MTDTVLTDNSKTKNNKIPHSYRFASVSLALAASVALGILSFAGTLSLGFGVPFAIFAFIMAGTIESQVFDANITEAFKLLFQKNTNNKYNLRKPTHILALILATLFAIAIGLMTFNSAIIIFPIIPAVIISSIAAAAFAFIMHNTLVKSLEKLSTLKKQILSSKADNPKQSWIKFIAHKLKNYIYPDKKINLNNLAIFIAITATVTLNIFVLFTTGTTWFNEIMFLPYFFGIIGVSCNNIFLLINSIETASMLSIDNIIELIKTPFKDSAKEINSNKGLLYNPFFVINSILRQITVFLSIIAHSITQALTTSRSFIVTMAATLTDMIADAHRLGEIDAEKRNKSQHHGKHDNDHDHDHEHIILDTITLIAQLMITAPLQPFAILTNYIVSNVLVKQNKSLLESTKECYKFVLDSKDKQPWKFIISKFESKSTHNNTDCNPIEPLVVIQAYKAGYTPSTSVLARAGDFENKSLRHPPECHSGECTVTHPKAVA